MELRVVNFEILTRHYKTYRDGLNVIENKKSELLQKIEPYRKSINSLIAESINGSLNDRDSNELQFLKDNILEMEKNFNYEIREIMNELNVNVYKELSLLINDWSVINNIDVVFSSVEVVFLKKEHDSTNEILDVIKSKNMFVDYKI
jgi:Skp family chaperone for outer membrane proteins